MSWIDGLLQFLAEIPFYWDGELPPGKIGKNSELIIRLDLNEKDQENKDRPARP